MNVYVFRKSPRPPQRDRDMEIVMERVPFDLQNTTRQLIARSKKIPNLSRRCNRCNVAREPWQIWEPWQSSRCMLLNLKG